MELKNSFQVPAPPEQAWSLLLDVQRIAPCLPGAKLTEVVDDNTFKGRATVKVGPVSLSFEGVANLVDVDPEARTARLLAKGNDPKGRGAAQAETRFALVPEGTGTRVDIVTDLSLTGAVAQYGRGSGLMQEVANQLIGQFARNLEKQLLSKPEEGEAASSDTATRPAPAETQDNAISGISLLLASLKGLIGGWWRGLFGSRR
jgi:uncharacterized protein